MIISSKHRMGHKEKSTVTTTNPTLGSPLYTSNSLGDHLPLQGHADPTVVGETLTVFSMPQIWKTGQCFAVDKTFLEIFVGNYNFLKFREAFNALFLPVWPRLD